MLSHLKSFPPLQRNTPASLSKPSTTSLPNSPQSEPTRIQRNGSIFSSPFPSENSVSIPSAATTPSAQLSSSSAPCFQLVCEYLDEQWQILQLNEVASDDDDHVSDQTEKNDIQSNNQSASSVAELAASWSLESAESERQLREALRDADAADWQRDRAISDAKSTQKALETATSAAATARSDVIALQECIATLTAAHQVDARINDVLVKDQAEEIRQLRDSLNKLTIIQDTSKRCMETFGDIEHSFSTDDGFSSTDDETKYESVETVLPSIEAELLATKHSTTSSIQTKTINTRKETEQKSTNPKKKREKDKTNKEGSSKHRSETRHTSANTQRKHLATSCKSIRTKNSRKVIEALRREKQRLLHSYERRHSMTIESVIRRSSSKMLFCGNTATTETVTTTHTAQTTVSETPMSESSISQPDEMV